MFGRDKQPPSSGLLFNFIDVGILRKLRRHLEFNETNEKQEKCLQFLYFRTTGE
jgi:hypothetical protein